MGSNTRRKRVNWAYHAFIVKNGVLSAKSYCGIYTQPTKTSNRCPSCEIAIKHNVLVDWVKPAETR